MNGQENVRKEGLKASISMWENMQTNESKVSNFITISIFHYPLIQISMHTKFIYIFPIALNFINFLIEVKKYRKLVKRR